MSPDTVAMNELWLKGKWKELKGQAREKWGKLTDDDMDRVMGRKDQLIGAIQQRYGLAKEKAEQQVEQWESEHGDSSTDSVDERSH